LITEIAGDLIQLRSERPPGDFISDHRELLLGGGKSLSRRADGVLADKLVGVCGRAAPRRPPEAHSQSEHDRKHRHNQDDDG
jgi:hypothetical protein